MTKFTKKVFFAKMTQNVPKRKKKMQFVCMVCIVWIHHALRFQILCIFTKAQGATLKVLISQYL